MPTTTQTRRAFLAGEPIVLALADASGVNGGASQWRHVALWLRDGAICLRLPGSGRGDGLWEPTFALDGSPMPAFCRPGAPIRREALRVACEALRLMATGEEPAQGWEWLAPVRCPGAPGKRCGDLLTHPRSIAAGRGPTCSGLEARRAARRAKAASNVASFEQRMRARLGLA